MKLLPSRDSYHGELLWNLTLRELRGKYKRSILGWGWSLVNPVVFMGIYSLVFGVLLKTDPPTGDPSGIKSYAFFLIAGLLPWTYHSNCINGSVMSLSNNVNLIRKVYFPRWILPSAAVGSWLITFAIELTVLTVAFLFAGNLIIQFLPLVAVVVVLQTAFSLGIGLAAASLNAFYRDVEYLTNIVLQLWFWVTPIIWPPSLLTEEHTIAGIELATIVRWNPMYHFVEAYRLLMYDGRLPGWHTWVILLLCSVLSLALGSLVFRWVEPRLAEEL